MIDMIINIFNRGIPIQEEDFLDQWSGVVEGWWTGHIIAIELDSSGENERTPDKQS